MPDSEAKKAWIRNNTTRFVMNLNNRTDADLIKCLRGKESMQGYIKKLIRNDIARQKTE